MTRKTKVKIMQYLLGLACAIGLALAIVMGLGGCAHIEFDLGDEPDYEYTHEAQEDFRNEN